MKVKFFLLSIFIGLGSLAAQSFVGNNNVSNSEPDTLKILAVMVEFQEDNYDATTGTGKFGSHYTVAYGDTILDPLPHDAEYFSDHLEFAKNYFYKVSGGSLVIDYHVIPRVVTLDEYMRDFWPPYDSGDFSPLADLAKKSWESVNEMTGINFADYELFMLFHAGVSNSLDDGSLTLDRNLPTLYLSEETLAGIYGSGFNGLVTGDGEWYVRNTIILPETESREYELITGDVILQELTINGVIVTNIASHLGLPDLFDTSTGRSRIGRFGLMDSQASIANWGLFPPMPSAWEKIFLGWDEAAVFTGSDSYVTLTAAAAALAGDTTILKVPINSSEYYLVENRIKDAGNDNIILKYKLKGEIFEKTVYPDEEGNYYIENDEIDGVLIDVDDYDASLPGEGIVIWHIDENVIREKGPLNEINNDKQRPGIDVEEADGIQDLGEVFQTIFGDVLVGEGSVYDFWYSANESELFSNRFAYDTKPSTQSNYGVNSFITMGGFSDIANKMTFRVSYENSEIETITAQNLGDVNYFPKYLTALSNEGNNFYNVVDVTGRLTRLDESGTVTDTMGYFSLFQPLNFLYEGREYLAGSYFNKLNIIYFENGSPSEIIHDLGDLNITAPLAAGESGGEIYLLLGFETGQVFRANLGGFLSGGFSIPQDYYAVDIYDPVKFIAAKDNYYCWVTNNNFYDSEGSSIVLPADAYQLLLEGNGQGDYISYVLTEGNRVQVITGGILLDEIELYAPEEIRKVLLADLNNDGENHLLFNEGYKTNAVNRLGVIADNYPLRDYFGITFSKEILLLEGNENEPDDMLIFSADGRISRHNTLNLQIISPFPVSSGAEIRVHPVLFTADPVPDLNGDERLFLSLVNSSNDLYVWDIGPAAGVKWAGLLGDGFNSSFISSADNTSPTGGEELAPEAYNWPNPVYEDITYIRFNLTETANVRIRIFDLAGDLVEEISTSGSGGLDNEVSLDVSNYESGVYFASLEITAVNGSRSENKLIKIAVIK